MKDEFGERLSYHEFARRSVAQGKLESGLRSTLRRNARKSTENDTNPPKMPQGLLWESQQEFAPRSAVASQLVHVDNPSFQNQTSNDFSRFVFWAGPCRTDRNHGERATAATDGVPRAYGSRFNSQLSSWGSSAAWVKSNFSGVIVTCPSESIVRSVGWAVLRGGGSMVAQ